MITKHFLHIRFEDKPNLCEAISRHQDNRELPKSAAVESIACPRCASARTERLSQFGSTACKAHYRCLECLEPFDYFKPH